MCFPPFYYLFISALLALHCCLGFSLVAAGRGYSPVMHKVLTAVAYLVKRRRL